MPRAFTDQERQRIRDRLCRPGGTSSRGEAFARPRCEQLAREAAISKGAFYLFFPSKEALLLAVIEEFETQFQQRLEAQVVAAPHEAVRMLLQAALNARDENPLMELALAEETIGVLRTMTPEQQEAFLNRDVEMVTGILGHLATQGVRVPSTRSCWPGCCGRWSSSACIARTSAPRWRRWSRTCSPRASRAISSRRAPGSDERHRDDRPLPAVRGRARGRRSRSRRAARRDLRLPGTERGRQDHDHPHAARDVPPLGRERDRTRLPGPSRGPRPLGSRRLPGRVAGSPTPASRSPRTCCASARLRGVRDAAVLRAIERLGLASYASRRARTLSQGNRQRLGLAMALFHEPDLLILDEPANGLDPSGVVEVRELLRSLAVERGVTILMSSHILAEVDRLASRIGVIHRGRLIEELSTRDMEARRRRSSSSRPATSSARAGRSAPLAASPTPAIGVRADRTARGRAAGRRGEGAGRGRPSADDGLPCRSRTSRRTSCASRTRIRGEG